MPILRDEGISERVDFDIFRRINLALGFLISRGVRFPVKSIIVGAVDEVVTTKGNNGRSSRHG